MDLKNKIILFGILLSFIILPAFALAKTWSNVQVDEKDCGDFSSYGSCNQCGNFYEISNGWNPGYGWSVGSLVAGHRYTIKTVLDVSWAKVECKGGSPWGWDNCDTAAEGYDECSVSDFEITFIPVIPPPGMSFGDLYFGRTISTSLSCGGECDTACSDIGYNYDSDNTVCGVAPDSFDVEAVAGFNITGFADEDNDGDEEYIRGIVQFTQIEATITEVECCINDDCPIGCTCENYECVCPGISSPVVSTKPASSIEKTSANFNGYLDDDGGEACRTRFNWGYTSSYGNNTAWSESEDSFYYHNSVLDEGTCYHFRAEAENSEYSDTGGDEKFITYPEPPYNVSAAAQSDSEIEILWSKGDGASDADDYVHITRKEDSCPTSPSDGTSVGGDEYGTSYTDSELEPDIEYCYSLFSNACDGDCGCIENDLEYECRCDITSALAECDGNLDAYPETDTAPCDFTIDIYNVDNCQYLTWRVERNGSYIDSGTVGSNENWEETLSDNNLDADSYNYVLKIDGDAKDSDSVTCSEAPPPENNPPTCNYLSASPDSGKAPLDVIFTVSGGDSDGTVVQYEFDFGDGSSKVYSSTAGATHTYNAVGTYCAKLRVKDDDGAWSTNTGNCPGGTCTQTITVTEVGVAISPPDVETVSYTNLTQTSVTLNGYLHDLGGASQCIVWFEWGPTASYGSRTSYLTKTSPGSFTTNLSLDPGTTYYFEAFAKNGGSW